MRNPKTIRIFAFFMAMLLCLSTIATALAGYETIPYGERSDRVRKLQKALKEKDCYSGKVDGLFGPATKAAVKKFQNSIGIKADGKPGNRTLKALYEGVSALNQNNNVDKKDSVKAKNPSSLYYGCEGERVKDLQRALRKAGYYKGSADGLYGDLTVGAVKRFQKANGLYADGIAGTKTLASLRKATGSSIGSSFVLDIGSTGSEVRTVTRWLSSHKHSQTGALYLAEVKSTYDNAVKVAVQDWQADIGISTTGTITQSQYNKYFID